jgi:hypothetical protein
MCLAAGDQVLLCLKAAIAALETAVSSKELTSAHIQEAADAISAAECNNSCKKICTAIQKAKSVVNSAKCRLVMDADLA